MEVEEKFVFELLPGIDASWRKSGIPISGHIFLGDNEGFYKGCFVSSS
jgi:hypothetical protein